MKTKSLKKLDLKKSNIVKLSKKNILAIKGQGTCYCNTAGPTLCFLQ